MRIKATDFLRWALALILLYLIGKYSMVGILYAFEFIVRLLMKFKFIIYITLYFPMLSILLALGLMIPTALVSLTIAFTVRQRKALSIVFGILFSLEIILLLILFWTGVIELSWEILPYSKLNKVFFSLLIGSLLYIPFMVYNGTPEVEDTTQLTSHSSQNQH